MSGRKIVCVGVAILWLATSRAQAQHGGMHHASWHGWHGGGASRQAHGTFSVSRWVGGSAGSYGGYAPCWRSGQEGSFPRLAWMGPSFMPAGDRSCRHLRRACWQSIAMSERANLKAERSCPLRTAHDPGRPIVSGR